MAPTADRLADHPHGRASPARTSGWSSQISRRTVTVRTLAGAVMAPGLGAVAERKVGAQFEALGGRIEAVGSGVMSFQVSDRVFGYNEGPILDNQKMSPPAARRA